MFAVIIIIIINSLVKPTAWRTSTWKSSPFRQDREEKWEIFLSALIHHWKILLFLEMSLRKWIRNFYNLTIVRPGFSWRVQIFSWRLYKGRTVHGSVLVHRSFSWDPVISTILDDLVKWNNFDEDLSFGTAHLNRLNSSLLIDFPEQMQVYKMTFCNFQIAYFLLQDSCH